MEAGNNKTAYLDNARVRRPGCVDLGGRKYEEAAMTKQTRRARPQRIHKKVSEIESKIHKKMKKSRHLRFLPGLNS
jgi:hypothetical protein